MTSERDERKLSIILMPDWGPAPRSLVISWKRARAMAVGIPLIMVGLAVMAVSWIFLAMKAATADDLQAENLALIASRDSMAVLAERLAGLEARETQLRVLSGLERSADAALWLPGAPGAAAGEWNPAGDTAVSPTMWPLTERGFVTQSLLEGGRGRAPGHGHRSRERFLRQGSRGRRGYRSGGRSRLRPVRADRPRKRPLVAVRARTILGCEQGSECAAWRGHRDFRIHRQVHSTPIFTSRSSEMAGPSTRCRW